MGNEENMLEEIKVYVKNKKIPYKYLSDEMGFSTEYICKMLAEGCAPSLQFNKLLMMAVCSFLAKDYKDLKGILGGTQWEPMLISSF